MTATNYPPKFSSGVRRRLWNLSAGTPTGWSVQPGGGQIVQPLMLDTIRHVALMDVEIPPTAAGAWVDWSVNANYSGRTFVDTHPYLTILKWVGPTTPLSTVDWGSPAILRLRAVTIMAGLPFTGQALPSGAPIIEQLFLQRNTGLAANGSGGTAWSISGITLSSVTMYDGTMGGSTVLDGITSADRFSIEMKLDALSPVVTVAGCFRLMLEFDEIGG